MQKRLVARLGKHSNDGKAEPRDTLGRKLACCLSAKCPCCLDRCQKTVPVPMGLMTNWPYRTYLVRCLPEVLPYSIAKVAYVCNLPVGVNCSESSRGFSSKILIRGKFTTKPEEEGKGKGRIRKGRIEDGNMRTLFALLRGGQTC
jgi:hypothetical protein